MLLKKLVVFIAIAVAFTLSGCNKTENTNNQNFTVPTVTGEFSFSVLKVGQADAIVMQTQNHNIIIDCGEEDDGDEVLEYLSDNGIENIDYLFITHFDKDHVGGAADVIDNVKIDNIITPNYQGTNNEYKNYIASITENEITPNMLTDNMSFILDDVLFEVYAPERTYYAEGDNDFSIAIGVTHGQNNFLFAGDAEEVRLSEIVSQTNREYDFLKVPHHGKFNKYTQNFVASINPSYSIITCSEKNPAEEQVVNILEEAGSTVYYTKDGNVTVKSDGEQILINQ